MFLAPKDFVRDPAALAAVYTVPEAETYTRWLATHHYENFHVVSWLLPKRLHQDFYTAESLRLLGWWREELDAMYAGRTGHPVFVALAGTVERHQIPPEPFDHLIRAFEQDQRVTRYANWDELFAYCRHSANPVGRLVLYLCGYADAERQRLSDATCTALQLANFWQDVPVDWEKGRVYMPLDVLERHGCSVEDIAARRATPGFIAAMRESVERARQLFLEGLPLTSTVDRRLALDIELFSRGGMRVLDKIAAQNYDVLARRPAISKTERVWLLLGTLARMALARAA